MLFSEFNVSASYLTRALSTKPSAVRVELRLLRRLTILLPLLVLAPSSLTAADDDNGYPHHHVAVFTGLGVESKKGREDERGFAVGGQYELIFHKNWGVGGLVEFLGQDTVRNLVLIFPVSIHPGGHWRLFFGPGAEFTPTKDKFAFRFGAGYEFHLGGHFSLAPELFVDLIESGENTWVAGVALGYEF